VLVLTCGYVGTGKTTVAEYLSSDLGAELLSTDAIRKEMFKPTDGKEIESLRNNPEELMKKNRTAYFDRQPEIPPEMQRLIDIQRKVTYDELREKTTDLLKDGRNVVLDGTFFRKELRERFYDAVRESGTFGTNVCLIHCICDEKVVAKRMAERKEHNNTDSDVEKMDLYNNIKASFEDPSTDMVTIIEYRSDDNTLKILNDDLADPDEMRLLERSLYSMINGFKSR
jgi:hypothetical protein